MSYVRSDALPQSPIESAQDSEKAGLAWDVGAWRVHADTGELRRGSELHRLEPKVGEVLVYLAKRAGQVVSRDELLGAIWPGVVVGDDALTQAIIKLRKALGDDAKQPTYIETLAKRGYRLKEQAQESAATAPVQDRRRTESHPDRRLALPEKASIAILPFDNISGDAEQSYFIDGLTEDITTELSRFRSLFVIARNSAFTYKGRAVDVRQVARELGVRYVLEGSARRAGARVRVNAQLIDAMSGAHIWADKFDRVVEDIFDLQEGLARSIVGAIATQVRMAEESIARRLRPGNLRAHDMAMRANANSLEASRRNDRSLWNKALGEARQALALDGDNLLAHLVIAEIQTKNVAVPQFADGDLTADWKEGITSAGKAMELDPADSRAFGWAGFLMSIAGFYDEGLIYARQGFALNPNDCLTVSNLSATEVWAGDHQQAIAHSLAAERLSPLDPNRYYFRSCRACACFFLRDFEAGMAFAAESVLEAPHSVMSHMSLILVGVGAGEVDRAKSAFEAMRRLSPAYAHRAVTQDAPLRKPEDRQRFALAARIAAGLELPDRAVEVR